MTNARLDLQPKGTVLLRCEVPLRYDCKKPPKLDDVEVKLTRFPIFGLILTHEYVIDQARIESVAAREGQVPGCKDAKGYMVTIHYWLSHKLKVEIPLLKLGKGEAGWVSRSKEYWALLRAESVCCDPDFRPKSVEEREVRPLHGFAVAGAGAATAAPGGVFALIRGYSWWEIGIALVVSAVALSLAIVILRLI